MSKDIGMGIRKDTVENVHSYLVWLLFGNSIHMSFHYFFLFCDFTVGDRGEGNEGGPCYNLASGSLDRETTDKSAYEE